MQEEWTTFLRSLNSGDDKATVEPRRTGAKHRHSLAFVAARLRRKLRSPSTNVHNERVIWVQAIPQAVFGSGASAFVAVFLVRLGAPNWLVGLLTSLPALVMTFAALPAGSLVQRQRNLVATANWGRIVFRVVIGLFALLPLLPANIAPYILVGTRSLASIPQAVQGISFTTIWGQATAPERRARMLSNRWAIHGLFSACFGFLAGQWLDSIPYPLNYQVLFASAFVASLIDIAILSRLRLPQVSEREIKKRQDVSLGKMLSLIKGARLFRNYSIATFVFRLGLWLPMALFPIYRVRTLGSSDSWIGVLLTVQRSLSVVAYLGLGRLLSRRRNRRWLWVSCLGMALYPIATALARTPEMLLIPQIISGFSSPSVTLFLNDTLFRVTPEDDRPTFVATNSSLAQLTAFAAPIVGTFLADATSIRLVLVLATGIRILGALAFWRLRVGDEEQNIPRTAD